MTPEGPSPDGWFRIDVPVRFRDLDPMGHAHHTLPIIYLEEARAAFWRALRGPSLAAIDYVMAEVTVRFHARIGYPSVLTTAVAVARVGTSSFTLEFEIRDPAGSLVASGSAVQVSFDYEAGGSKPLPAGVRAALDAWHERRAAQEKSSAIAADTTPMKPPST